METGKMITLFDKWVIVVDNYSYQLAEYLGESVDKKTGRKSPNYRTYGYYRTLHEALDALRLYMIRKHLSDGTRTLKEAIDTIREDDEKIRKLIANVGVEYGI